MKKLIKYLLCITLLMLVGCHNTDIKQDHDSNQAIGYANDIFDTSYVHKINVDISEDDFKDLLENPLDKTKYETTVTIDGTTLEHVSFATKGNTSLSQVADSDSNRYSFKLDFDKFQDGQTYFGLDKLNLNNTYSDATYMKDYLSYEIMRAANVKAPLASYVELSINNEVHGLYIAVEEVDEVFITRNYNDSGVLYKPDSESLGNMGQKENNRFLGNNQNETGDSNTTKLPENGEFDPSTMTPPNNGEFDPSTMTPPNNGEFDPSTMMPPNNGEFDSNAMTPPSNGDFDANQHPFDQNEQNSLREQNNQGADLVYIDDNIDSYKAIFDNIETDYTQDDQNELIQALKDLNTLENVEVSWNVDEILNYFVAHNFVLNFDSYTGNMLHNYYLYENNGKVTILPWDYNLAFGGFGMMHGMQSTNSATSIVNYPIDTPLSSSNNEQRPLWNLIASNDEYMNQYHEKFKELITCYFANNECVNEIQRIYQMIQEYVKNDPTAFYTYDQFEKAVTTLKTFVSLRAQSIQGQLDGSIPSTRDTQTDTTNMIDASHINIEDMGTQNGRNNPNQINPFFQKPNPNENQENSNSENL